MIKKTQKEILQEELKKLRENTTTRFEKFREDLKYYGSRINEIKITSDNYKWLGSSIKRSELYLLLSDIYKKLDKLEVKIDYLIEDNRKINNYLFSLFNEKK